MGCDLCDGDREVKVYFCPDCKSTDVKYVFGLGNLFGVIPKMRCGKCGLEMASFPLLVTSKNKLKKSCVVKKTKRRAKK